MKRIEIASLTSRLVGVYAWTWAIALGSSVWFALHVDRSRWVILVGSQLATAAMLAVGALFFFRHERVAQWLSERVPEGGMDERPVSAALVLRVALFAIGAHVACAALPQLVSSAAFLALDPAELRVDRVLDALGWKAVLEPGLEVLLGLAIAVRGDLVVGLWQHIEGGSPEPVQ